VLMAEHFIGKGLSLLVYDPEVRLSSLLGANRRFIDQHVPHIAQMIRGDIADVLAESDVLVVGLSDRLVFEALKQHVRTDHVILDLVNIPDGKALRGQHVGLCW
jgi:GDP-mannose 6-dehydrogenase